ncbi:MAG: hypothetical protein K5654_07905 [Lachnospiraceae bacterium]|nr:hypothetical protein [Lachnospiraceae bacterium]
MASIVKSFSLSGINGYRVDVETSLIQGKASISIIGLGDTAIKEAAERIRSALSAYSFDYPQLKIIINLAPGDFKKRGSHYDLAMAVGLLQASNQIHCDNLSDFGFLGELSLTGNIRHCKGIIPMVLAAKENSVKNIIIPYDNFPEVVGIEGVNIIPTKTIKEVVDLLEGKEIATDYKQLKSNYVSSTIDTYYEKDSDYSDVKSQSVPGT